MIIPTFVLRVFKVEYNLYKNSNDLQDIFSEKLTVKFKKLIVAKVLILTNVFTK